MCLIKLLFQVGIMVNTNIQRIGRAPNTFHNSITHKIIYQSILSSLKSQPNHNTKRASMSKWKNIQWNGYHPGSMNKGQSSSTKFQSPPMASISLTKSWMVWSQSPRRVCQCRRIIVNNVVWSQIESLTRYRYSEIYNS